LLGSWLSLGSGSKSWPISGSHSRARDRAAGDGLVGETLSSVRTREKDKRSPPSALPPWHLSRTGLEQRAIDKSSRRPEAQTHLAPETARSFTYTSSSFISFPRALWLPSPSANLPGLECLFSSPFSLLSTSRDNSLWPSPLLHRGLHLQLQRASLTHPHPLAMIMHHSMVPTARFQAGTPKMRRL